MLIRKVFALIKKPLFPYPTKNLTIKEQILHDCRHFAQVASYATLIVTGISTTIGLIGVILVIQGQLTTGTLTTIGSFLATNSLSKIADDANQRIDRLLKDD